METEHNFTCPHCGGKTIESKESAMITESSTTIINDEGLLILKDCKKEIDGDGEVEYFCGDCGEQIAQSMMEMQIFLENER